MATAAEGTNLAFHILNAVDTPRGAVALVTGMVPQITNCDPSSTTRLAGIWKKSLALVAFLVRKAKRRARKGHMCWVLVNTMDSRER